MKIREIKPTVDADALLAGAQTHYVASDPARHFAADWTSVPEATWARTQLLYVCSPGNPTGAVMDLAMDIAASSSEVKQHAPNISRLELMKAALGGPLPDPAQARLQYAQALQRAGRTAEATEQFKALAGNESLGLLARLWQAALTVKKS